MNTPLGMVAWPSPLRRFLLPAALLAVLAGCATVTNTPAQDLAWERWQECNRFPALRLREIRPNGEVWVEWTNGQTQAAEWRACMREALAVQERAGKLSATAQPALSADAAKALVQYAYFTNRPPTPGTYLHSAILPMPPDVKEFPGDGPVTFFYALKQVGRSVSVQTRWIAPDGTRAKTMDTTMNQAGRPGTWSWQTHTVESRDLPQRGQWAVELLIDGHEVGRYVFTLLRGGGG